MSKLLFFNIFFLILVFFVWRDWGVINSVHDSNFFLFYFDVVFDFCYEFFWSWIIYICTAGYLWIIMRMVRGYSFDDSTISRHRTIPLQQWSGAMRPLFCRPGVSVVHNNIFNVHINNSRLSHRPVQYQGEHNMSEPKTVRLEKKYWPLVRYKVTWI